MEFENHLYLASDEDTSLLTRILDSRYGIKTKSISNSDTTFLKFFHENFNSMSFSNIKYIFFRFKIETIAKLLSYSRLDDNFLQKAFESLDILISKINQNSQSIKIIFSTFSPEIIGENNYLIYKNITSSYNIYSILNQYLYDLKIKNENIWILPNSTIFPIDDVKGYKHLVRTKSTLDITSSEKLACKLSKYLLNNKNPFPKIIFLDLDNTLWGGALAEDQSLLRIGGHDPIGEAYADLQNFFKNLKSKGVLLAIVSKNDEKNVKEFFKNNSYMPLNFNDFVTYRINWNNKSQNILSILEELNLSSKDAIFIDDNTHERDEVRSNLPEIKIPEFPNDIYARLLFFSNFIPEKRNPPSEEDELRTDMYKARSSRIKNMKTIIKNENESNSSKYIEWLKTLKIELEISKVKKDLPIRLIQLFKRTNQFNLTSHHPDKNDLDLYLNKGYTISFCTVKDKFGDEGMVLAAVYKINSKDIIFEELVMSCRVFGRFLEYAFLKSIILNNYNNPELIHMNFNLCDSSTNKSSSNFVKNLMNQDLKLNINNQYQKVSTPLLLKQKTGFIKLIFKN